MGETGRGISGSGLAPTSINVKGLDVGDIWIQSDSGPTVDGSCTSDADADVMGIELDRI